MINKLEMHIATLGAILAMPSVRKALHESDLRDLNDVWLSLDVTANKLASEIENTKSFILAKSAELMEYVND